MSDKQQKSFKRKSVSIKDGKKMRRVDDEKKGYGIVHKEIEDRFSNEDCSKPFATAKN